jgi:hypothetical protein
MARTREHVIINCRTDLLESIQTDNPIYIGGEATHILPENNLLDSSSGDKVLSDNSSDYNINPLPDVSGEESSKAKRTKQPWVPLLVKEENGIAYFKGPQSGIFTIKEKVNGETGEVKSRRVYFKDLNEKKTAPDYKPKSRKKEKKVEVEEGEVPGELYLIPKGKKRTSRKRKAESPPTDGEEKPAKKPRKSRKKVVEEEILSTQAMDEEVIEHHQELMEDIAEHVPLVEYESTLTEEW